MQLICKDGQEREFISLFELYVQRGFDPAFLIKDNGLLSLDNPPNVSFLKLLQLAKLGVSIDAYFWHYSWIYRKANPVSIALNKVMDGYKWVALSPAFEWENGSQLIGVKLGIFTLLARVISKTYYFFTLNKDKKFYKTLILPIDGLEFNWSTGYEYFGLEYSVNIGEKLVHLIDKSGDTDKNIYLHPTVFAWSMRVFVAK